MSTSVSLKLWQRSSAGDDVADGYVGRIAWRILSDLPLGRRDARQVARRRRLLRRKMRRMLDRHDRCWDGVRAEARAKALASSLRWYQAFSKRV